MFWLPVSILEAHSSTLSFTWRESRVTFSSSFKPFIPSTITHNSSLHSPGLRSRWRALWSSLRVYSSRSHLLHDSNSKYPNTLQSSRGTRSWGRGGQHIPHCPRCCNNSSPNRWHIKVCMNWRKILAIWDTKIARIFSQLHSSNASLTCDSTSTPGNVTVAPVIAAASDSDVEVNSWYVAGYYNIFFQNNDG